MKNNSRYQKLLGMVVNPVAVIKKIAQNYRLRRMSQQEIFTDIFKSNGFGGTESVSGPGSSLSATKVIRDWLPTVLEKYKIRSMLDIPCGDFNWMKFVDLKGAKYFGADIVGSLIERNQSLSNYESDSFQVLNLTTDKLPKVDLIFCRDCLVHLSFRDIAAALRNISQCGAKYLITTTFPRHPSNVDIPTGAWRTLNLQAAPFFFADPLEVIEEGYTEFGGEFADKSLGLWSLQDLAIPDNLV